MTISRRSLLASGPAGGVAMAQRASVPKPKEPPPSDIRDAKAPPMRRLLESRFTLAKVSSSLLPRGKWKLYPTASERGAWESLNGEVRAKAVAEAERHREGEWTIPKATRLLEYVRIGNRSEYERELQARRTRLLSLVVGECMEGKGRFLDEIANGVWSTCEETWWGYPAHLNAQRRGHGLPDVTEPVIDLFAAEASNMLAWTYYLLAPQLAKVHKMVPERIELEIERRILAPYRMRDDFWWMGFKADRPMNNWNPWINSNCLATVLVMDTDEKRRAAMVHKIIRSVDRFLDSYTEDGGCDEGPGYWGHAGGSLFDNLELLHSASNGAIDGFGIPVVQEIGRYIYRVNIADDWYVNFADASARVGISGDLVFRYGKRIGDENMQALGALEATSGPSRGTLLRLLPGLFNETIRKAPARRPLIRDAWMPGIQVMTARVRGGSPKGLYLAAQGGHNAESHNHNDVGNFIVYADGKPCIIDVGVETYSAKTFSSRRYEIWTMQSAYHNLPTVNGVMQGAGRAFAASEVVYRAGDDAAEFSLDIAGAYPAEAGIESWRRTLRLDRANNEVVVRDVWTLRKDGGQVAFSLMTPHEVKQAGPGELVLSGVRISYPGSMTVSIEEVSTQDGRLQPVWGPKIRRIQIRGDNVRGRGECVVRIRQV